MYTRGAAGWLNHLLGQHAWARERLADSRGETVLFRSPPLPDVHLEILESGLVQPAPAGIEPFLTVTLRPDLLPRLMLHDESAISQVSFAGSPALAETVQLLMRDLKWDAGEDLARVFGDVIAQRITSTGESLLAWQREAAQRLGANFAEYFTEEQPVLVRKVDLLALAADIDRVREDTGHLEQRIAKLER